MCMLCVRRSDDKYKWATWRWFWWEWARTHLPELSTIPSGDCPSCQWENGVSHFSFPVSAAVVASNPLPEKIATTERSLIPVVDCASPKGLPCSALLEGFPMARTFLQSLHMAHRWKCSGMFHCEEDEIGGSEWNGPPLQSVIIDRH